MSHRFARSQARKVNLSKIVVSSAVLSLAMAMIVLVRFFFSHFKLQQIVCIRFQSNCSQNELQTLSLLQGRMLPFIKRVEVEALLSQSQIVRFHPVFPNKLEIELATIQPDAIVATNKTRLLVSSVGQIVGTVTEDALPIVANPDLTIVDNFISDPATIAAIKLAIALSRAQINFESVVVQNQSNPPTLQIVSSQTLVVFSPTKDPKESITTLQQLQSKVRIGTNQPRQIDLRFAQPVITY